MFIFYILYIIFKSGYPAYAWRYRKSTGIPTGGLYGNTTTFHPYFLAHVIIIQMDHTEHVQILSELHYVLKIVMMEKKLLNQLIFCLAQVLILFQEKKILCQNFMKLVQLKPHSLSMKILLLVVMEYNNMPLEQPSEDMLLK